MKKLLMIGMGSVGRRHLANFRAAGVEYIAGADPRPDRLEQANAEAGLDGTYSGHLEALDTEAFDAVAITAPTSMHTEIAIDAARKGAHLFIEKPVDNKLDGLDELQSICREKNLACFIAYCYRFIPYVRKMEIMLKDGVIGRPLAARLEFSTYLPDWHPWEDYRTFYMAKKDQGGGALLDESHGIDLLRMLFGEVETVSAFVGNVSDLEITSDDLAALHLKFKNGMFAEAHFDLLGRKPRVEMEIIGSEGTLLWDRIANTLSVWRADKEQWETETFTPDDLLSMYTSEVAHFIACVNGTEKPIVDLEDSIKTLKVLLAALESSASGKTVSVD